jgi:hypothetical protein
MHQATFSGDRPSLTGEDVLMVMMLTYYELISIKEKRHYFQENAENLECGKIDVFLHESSLQNYVSDTLTAI